MEYRVKLVKIIEEFGFISEEDLNKAIEIVNMHNAVTSDIAAQPKYKVSNDLTHYKNPVIVFTDGSYVNAGYISYGFHAYKYSGSKSPKSYSKRKYAVEYLSGSKKGSSANQAEFLAIVEAINYVKENSMAKEIIIFSDSNAAIRMFKSNTHIEIPEDNRFNHVSKAINYYKKGLVTIEKVKGHSDIDAHNRIDKAIDKQRDFGRLCEVIKL